MSHLAIENSFARLDGMGRGGMGWIQLALFAAAGLALWFELYEGGDQGQSRSLELACATSLGKGVVSRRGGGG